jgi:hypothetical protein
MLDLNEVEPEHVEALAKLDHRQRVAMGCWAAEYLLPVYKQFRDTHDWKVVDPVVAAGWTFIEKGKVKLPRKLWDQAGELTAHYYEEGIPLLLFSVSATTNLLRTIDTPDPERSSRTCARVLKTVVRLGEEVDAVLGRGSAAQGESRAWIADKLRELASGAELRPSGVDLDSGEGLPSWWSDLIAHPEPIRKRKLA